MKKLLASIFLFAAIGCAMVFAGGSSDIKGTQKAFIIGDDWGPAVSKTVITLNKAISASSINKDDFSVIERKEVAGGAGEAERLVLDAYACDAQGNRVEGDSRTFAIEMYVAPRDGSPFVYDVESGFNSWCGEYSLEVTLSEGSGLLRSNGKPVTSLAIEPAIDLEGDGKIVPQVDGVFSIDQKYTASNGDLYNYADYAPPEDSKQNALVIWLHGGGEGTNNGKNGSYIDLLGNEVTALASDEFQSLFEGAYVLVPQTPTRWMDGLDGEYQYGDEGSRYAESLFEFIDNYVSANPDIDTSRVLIGGCSNGGYMTVELILRHPDYFAAAFPICEYFLDEHISDEQIESIASLPIWFTYAKNDSVVNPAACAIPTVERLLAAGAEDVHVSAFDNVIDTTGRFFKDDGTPYEYSGHWSWIYFDNNECFDENGVNAWEWLASKSK